MTTSSLPAWLRRVLARSEPRPWLIALPGLCWWLAALAVFLNARKAAASYEGNPLGFGVPLGIALLVLVVFAAYAAVMGIAVFRSDAAPRWRALVLVVDWSPALALALLFSR